MNRVAGEVVVWMKVGLVAHDRILLNYKPEQPKMIVIIPTSCPYSKDCVLMATYEQ